MNSESALKNQKSNPRHKYAVLSLGGSIIFPDKGIDVVFLRQFKRFIDQLLAQEIVERVFIVTGGGTLARMYQDALSDVLDGDASADDLDWVGIRSTHLNAFLIRKIFGEKVHGDIITSYEHLGDPGGAIVVGGGGTPGNSTDYVSVQLAEHFDADTVVNLSNISQVFEEDPKKNPSAKPFDKLSWDDFLGLIDTTWQPGANVPFDPKAAQLAKEQKKKVVILDGRDFTNLEKYFKGDTFIGTIIK